MKKILIVAYDFPPMGGGGVMRISKFVKYLPVYGYNPIILTVKKLDYNPIDEILYREVKYSKIYRTENRIWFEKFKQRIKNDNNISKEEPLENLKGKSIKINLLRIIKKVKQIYVNNFIIPDSSVNWVNKSIDKAVDIVKNQNIDMIFVTSPPHAIQLIGLKLKKKLPQIHLVVDFRDGWTINPLYASANKLKEKLEKIYERNLVKCADKIICATKPIEEDYKIVYKKYANKFFTINNGYDGENYNFNRNNYIKNNKLTIMYTGSIGSKGVKAKYFLEACKNITTDLDIKNVLEIIFIGNFAEDKEYWNDKLRGNIEFMPLMSQNDVIKYTEKADLLMVTFMPEQGGKTVLTGKIFEYLAARRPILGLVPDSAARDFIMNNNLGFCAEPEDVKGIEEVIKQAYNLWKEDKLYIKSDLNLIRKYDRRKLTKVLASVFDEL